MSHRRTRRERAAYPGARPRRAPTMEDVAAAYVASPRLAPPPAIRSEVERRLLLRIIRQIEARS